MVIYEFCNQMACFIVDVLASISETTLEKLHEARRLNLIEKHQVAELVEWFGWVGKHFHHHVALAAIETIGHTLVQLPMWTQFFLEIVWVCKFRDILELIYANYDFQAFLLGNLFGKIEHFIRIAFYLLPIKVDWDLIGGVCTDWNLGNKMRKEALRTLDCFLPFCGSGGNYLLSEQRIEMLFATHIEKVDMTDSEVAVLRHR